MDKNFGARHLAFDIWEFSESENLLSREQGWQILKTIKEKSMQLPSVSFVFLDFRKIRYATAACLIEILNVMDFHDKYIILKIDSTNHDLKDCLILALNKKKLAIPSFDEKGNFSVLGELTKAEEETLKIIIKKGEITSKEISNLLGIGINAASNRLRELHNMKLIAREEKILGLKGGRQFVYRCMPCIN